MNMMTVCIFHIANILGKDMNPTILHLAIFNLGIKSLNKSWKPKPCLLMFVSLVALDDFHLLLSTQLTADLTLE